MLPYNAGVSTLNTFSLLYQALSHVSHDKIGPTYYIRQFSSNIRYHRFFRSLYCRRLINPQRPFNTHSYSRSNISASSNNGAGPNDACSGDGAFLNMQEGFVYSPGYPDQYQNDMTCSWTITVSLLKQKVYG